MLSLTTYFDVLNYQLSISINTCSSLFFDERLCDNLVDGIMASRGTSTSSAAVYEDL